MAAQTPATRTEASPPVSSVGNAAAMPERGSERDNQRTHLPARDYYRREARPEPMQVGHLKYHIDKKDFVPGCDHVWVAIRVNGMDSGQLRQYLSKGWVPARAMDFPKLSGHGVEYGAALRRTNYVPNVQPDDPIEIDGEMLLLRAEELSQENEAQRIRDAQNLVDTQMRRLEQASRRSLGSKADDLMKIQYGRQFANPDNFDAEVSGREV